MIVPSDILTVCICLTVLFLFYWGYRVHTSRSGILTLDIFLVSQMVVPIICFTPFAFSPENMMSTGLHFYRAYVLFVPSAFYVSLLGLLTFAVAALLFRSTKATAPGFTTVESSILGYWLTAEGCVMLFSMNALVLIVLALFGGDPTRIRYTVQEDTVLRPLSNAMNGITAMGLPIILVYGHVRRDWRFTLLALTMAAATAAFGTRAPVIGGFVEYAAIRVIAARDPRVFRSAVLLTAAMIVLIVGALALESLRDGEDAPSALASSLPRLAYGNNISDVRDFAWVMSRWDGRLLLGRTYISGSLAFIPSHFFAWRREWAWAPFSTEAAGMGAHVLHFGLRPGMSGEVYFNFGIVGVIVLALVVGGSFGTVFGASNRGLTADKRANAVVILCQLFYLRNFVVPLCMSSGWYSIYLSLILVGMGVFTKKTGFRMWPDRVAARQRVPRLASSPLAMGPST